MRRAKASLISVLVMCSSLAVTLIYGCHKSAAPLNSAHVMFVNGCLSVGTLSVQANSVPVDGASGIDFLFNSGYVFVTAGSGTNLTFFNDNAGIPLANKAENLLAPNHYSVFAGGTVWAPSYLFTADDLTPPASGNAKLRFVNLSSDNINETATANDTIIAQGVSANTVSSFYQLKAGAYAIGAFDPRKHVNISGGDTMAIQAGKIYTIVLTGTNADSGSTSGLLLSVIKNN